MKMKWKNEKMPNSLINSKIFTVFIFVFSFVNVVTHLYSKNGLDDRTGWLILLVNMLVVAGICFVTAKKIFTSSNVRKKIYGVINTTQNQVLSDGQYVFLTVVLELLGWIPVFLAYYPGLFAYDVYNQISQTFGSYSTHHPLIHTLYLKLFYKIGRDWFSCINTGIALATLTQLILFALMLSFIHLFLYRIGLNRILRWAYILFTSFFPIFSMMALSLTKDVFFTGFFGMVFVFLGYHYALPQWLKKKRYQALYIICIAGTVLLRNNGKYCIAMLCIVLIAQALWKRRGFHFAIWTILGLCLGILTASSLQFTLQAKNGSMNEMLSIPYQQIASVYHQHKEELAEENLQEILEIIPAIEQYEPHKSDSIKATANGAQSPKKLLKLYVKLGLQYPESYLRGFCRLNAGYLCLTDISYSQIYGTNNRQGVLLSDTKEGLGVVHMSLFPQLEALYEKLFTDNRYLDVLGMNLLFSPALYFWVIMFFFVMVLYLRNVKMYPMLAFLLMLLLTILAGPCSLIRYALPYIVCIPVLFACIIFGVVSQETTGCSLSKRVQS